MERDLLKPLIENGSEDTFELSRKESRKGRSCRRKGRMGKERWEEGRRGGSEMESSRTSLSHFSLPLSSSIYSPSASSCH